MTASRAVLHNSKQENGRNNKMFFCGPHVKIFTYTRGSIFIKGIIKKFLLQI